MLCYEAGGGGTTPGRLRGVGSARRAGQQEGGPGGAAATGGQLRGGGVALVGGGGGRAGPPRQVPATQTALAFGDREKPKLKGNQQGKKMKKMQINYWAAQIVRTWTGWGNGLPNSTT